MELNEILELANSESFSQLKSKMEGIRLVTDAAKFLKEYEPETHAVMDTAKRPDKMINKSETESVMVPVARLAIPLQKQIVSMAAAFLCGNPIQITGNPKTTEEQELLELVKLVWSKNKLDYESKNVAKTLFSETEVAEIWYYEKVDETYWKGTLLDGSSFRLRMKLISNGLSDSLLPVFNSSGDLVAFGRSYSIKVEGKSVNYFDVYTEEKVFSSVQNATGWTVTERPNPTKKIPIIYYYQKKTEWADVQNLIERFEKSLSNHADTNDYFASPMVKVRGEIENFATKGESGKVIQLKGDGADASYMSWDQSPKSQELEFKNLRSLIYDMTNTPDISLEQMKSLGTYSGIALKMLFLNAHLKAADKEENFGKSIQRRINFIKNALAKINVKYESAAQSLEITPVFEYYLPKNTTEVVEMLSTATGAKPTISQETAVSLNPLVKDAKEEFKKITNEDVPNVIQT